MPGLRNRDPNRLKEQPRSEVETNPRPRGFVGSIIASLDCDDGGFEPEAVLWWQERKIHENLTLISERQRPDFRQYLFRTNIPERYMLVEEFFGEDKPGEWRAEITFHQPYGGPYVPGGVFSNGRTEPYTAPV